MERSPTTEPTRLVCPRCKGKTNDPLRRTSPCSRCLGLGDINHEKPA